MKIKSVLLMMVMVLPSLLLAQAKGEMPFTSSSPEAKKLLREAWAAYADAEAEKGRNHVLKARELDPGFAMAFTIGINENWKDDIMRAQQMKASDDEKLYINAFNAQLEGKPIDSYVESLLKKYPNDKHLALQLSYFYMSNKPARSKEILEGIVKRDSKFAPAYNLLGYSYMGMKDMQHAEVNFNKYMSLRPDLANVYDSKAEFLENNGKYEEAAKLYDKAAEMGMTVSKMRAERCRGRMIYPAVTEKDVEAIKSMIAASAQEHVKGNVDGLLQHYAGQSIEIFQNQMVNVGKENMHQRVKTMFKNVEFEKLDITLKDVKGIGKIAVAWGTSTQKTKSTGTGEITEVKSNVFFFLRKQDDGQWKILMDHWVDSDNATFTNDDRTSAQQVLGKWVNSFGKEIITNDKIDNLAALYSDQAIEIYPSQRSNIGKANLRLRWDNFLLGARFENNALGMMGIDGMDRRAVAWGIGYQNLYPKDKTEAVVSRFPWLTLLAKERDDVWRILALHWYSE
jgi:ketosteroid isomerase-like protein